MKLILSRIGLCYLGTAGAVRWAAAVGLAVAIWLQSSIPFTGPARGIGWIVLHNAGHPLAYGLLTALLWAALMMKSRPPGSRGHAAGAVGLAVAFSAVDEWHQSFVPGRIVSVADVCAGACGAAAVIGLHRWVNGRGAGTLAVAVAAAAVTVAVASLSDW